MTILCVMSIPSGLSVALLSFPSVLVDLIVEFNLDPHKKILEEKILPKEAVPAYSCLRLAVGWPKASGILPKTVPSGILPKEAGGGLTWKNDPSLYHTEASIIPEHENIRGETVKEQMIIVVERQTSITSSLSTTIEEHFTIIAKDGRITNTQRSMYRSIDGVYITGAGPRLIKKLISS